MKIVNGALTLEAAEIGAVTAAGFGGIGPQGPQGVKGDTGAAGTDGAPGAQGAQGTQGIQGIQGIQGVQGPAGPGTFAAGANAGTGALPATTGTMTATMDRAVLTITPTGACTFNGSGGVAGQLTTFAITTSGVTSFTLTWGTNFRKTGTLATGTTSARFFSVTFRCLDGTVWQEIARTAAQT